MEAVTSWSRETVCGYLRGLDTSLQQYPFQEWDVTGHDLLSLSPQRLDALGVRSIGHQELILEAVEQLCALHYELHTENLRTLTEKLCCVSQSLCSLILGLRKTSMHSPSTAISPTPKQLACIIDIVSAARGLFSWLNRYLFTRLNDYSASRDIIALCMELADSLHEDWSNPRIENRILLICQNICEICKSILSYSPNSLLNQTATLELVQIHPEQQTDYKLGIDIKSTSSGQHFICETEAKSPAGRCDKILPGDEIIKVNDQTVVGWTRQNLVRKLVENSDCVTLVLKKVSVLSPLQSPINTTSQKIGTVTTPQQTYKDRNLPYEGTEATSPTKHRFNSLHLKIKAASSFKTWSTPSTPTDFEVSNLLQATSDANTIPVTISTATEAILGSSSTPKTQTPVIDLPQPQGLSCQPSSSHIQPISTNLSDSFTEKEQNILHSIVETQFLTPALPTTSQPACSSQHSSRPRSGSVTSPTASVPSTSPSPVVLRQSVSDSNLFSATNPAAPQKELEISEGPSKSLEPAVEVCGSPETVKKSQIGKRIQTHRTKVKPSGAPRYQKGVATKLSRRRVSCRDLGVPDCDGWLWKRKENAGFMSQKWKRCWCVLKGDRLYWYNAPQDEKALGLLNVSSYKLESTWEAKPKKKYEFQLSHDTYKPFVFAADSLDDMNKWVTCLIKTLQKHKVPPNTRHPPEEECYSETEAEVEEQDDDQSKPQELKQMAQSPTKNAKADKASSQAENVSTRASTETDSDGDELKLMISCLQQGGVSLIGTKTTLTRDEYRKSFIRRNKNPDINHKAHTLRVLQSTLKAKLLELDALNQILDNPSLNSSVFRQWKVEHDQLYETLWRGPRVRGSLGDFINNFNKEGVQGARGKDESESSD